MGSRRSSLSLVKMRCSRLSLITLARCVDQNKLISLADGSVMQAGVRGLERQIGKVCRSKAVGWSAARDKGLESKLSPKVSPDDIERILGLAKFEQEIREEQHRPGVVT